MVISFEEPLHHCILKWVQVLLLAAMFLDRVSFFQSRNMQLTLAPHKGDDRMWRLLRSGKKIEGKSNWWKGNVQSRDQTKSSCEQNASDIHITSKEENSIHIRFLRERKLVSIYRKRKNTKLAWQPMWPSSFSRGKKCLICLMAS